MSTFRAAHEKWLKLHESKRKGERLRRLIEGHGHAERLFLENVWWPAVGNLEHLHPEYEIFDFKDGRRFLDFGYTPGRRRMAVEILGHGPHARDITPREFCDQWMRQNDLLLDDWHLLCFGYDDVAKYPRRCQKTLLQALAKWFGQVEFASIRLSPAEEEVIRYAKILGGAIKTNGLCDWMRITPKQARLLMKKLVMKEILKPVIKNTYVVAYELIRRAR